MKTYLLTGGAGFIGSNFLKYILKKYKNINVVVVDILTYASNIDNIKEELKDKRVVFEKIDIRDEREIKKIFLKYEIDCIVNFAAETHVDNSIKDSRIFLETNILGTYNLIENSKESWMIGIDEKGYPLYKKNVKYIQISTDEVYGSLKRDYKKSKKIEFEDVKIKEVFNKIGITKTYGQENFKEGSPLNPKNPYAVSKAGGDQLIISYGNTYKYPFNISRCSNNFGPYQFYEKLIPSTIKKILEGEKIDIYGKGEQIRDWIYVEDHCKAIDCVINFGKIGEIYNIGSFGEKVNINVVKLIIDIFKEEISKKTDELINMNIGRVDYGLINFVQDRLGHDERYAINPIKIVKELGWYPEVNFEAGLRRTVKWYLENKEFLKNKNI